VLALGVASRRRNGAVGDVFSADLGHPTLDLQDAQALLGVDQQEIELGHPGPRATEQADGDVSDDDPRRRKRCKCFMDHPLRARDIGQIWRYETGHGKSLSPLRERTMSWTHFET